MRTLGPVPSCPRCVQNREVSLCSLSANWYSVLIQQMPVCVACAWGSFAVLMCGVVCVHVGSTVGWLAVLLMSLWTHCTDLAGISFQHADH